MSSSQDLFSQDVEMHTQESGLRSSELEYSDVSSMAPNSTQLGVTTTQMEPLTELPRHVIYGTDVNIGSVMEKFKNFILEFKTDQPDENFVSSIIFDPEVPYYLQKLNDLSETKLNWMDVNCQHLQHYSSELNKNLHCYPREVIPAMDEATLSILQNKYGCNLKVETRPFNCGTMLNLRSLSPEDLDHVVTLSGLIIRTSIIIPHVVRVVFQCSNCQNTTAMDCENMMVTQPDSCSHCQSRHSLNIEHNLCDTIDKQIVKLQESPDEMPAGQTPQTVTMYCYQHQVDQVQPGDRVVVTGIYRSSQQRENPYQRTVKTVLNTYIDVLHYKKASKGTEEAAASLRADRVAELVEWSQKPDLYERLSGSIAPAVYGNEDIKKGLLLQLMGGSSDSGSRGDIHVLLCGDPGTAKSQLLQYAHKVSQRSQYTSGKGTSGAGLTAYMTHDPETKHAVLQAGSLVLADNGLCCIDEFDKMADSTRSVLHEVMEQQTLSVAKAGVICQMNARTCVLAASNPVGSKWDTRQTIVDNIKLPPTLLSRFDLIFLMLNPQDEAYDAKLAGHLVSLYMSANDQIASAHEGDFVTLDFLRDFISYAKNVQPRLSPEAQQFLVEEYVSMRRLGGRGQITAYPRQLESLRRLSEARARVRLATVVSEADCREARRLQREALKQAAVDPATGLIDVGILATGVAEGAVRRRREVGASILAHLQQLQKAGRTGSQQYQKVLEDVRAAWTGDRILSRDLFEDGLKLLQADNVVHWAGKVIRIR